MRGFRRRGDRFVADADATERRILAQVVSDVAELLGGADPRGADSATGPGAVVDVLLGAPWPAEAPAPPDDPAVARLLPPASRDDAELAGEFRRLTEADLRTAKVANLHLVRDALRGPGRRLEVTGRDAPRWAAALTDVRLVLASRLGISTAEDAERVHDAAAHAGGAGDDDGAVDAALATLYSALTWLQESLVVALLGAPRDADDR